MVKRRAAAVMAACLMAGLTACGDEAAVSADKPSPSATATKTRPQSPTPTPTPTPMATATCYDGSTRSYPLTGSNPCPLPPKPPLTTAIAAQALQGPLANLAAPWFEYTTTPGDRTALNQAEALVIQTAQSLLAQYEVPDTRSGSIGTWDPAYGLNAIHDLAEVQPCTEAMPSNSGPCLTSGTADDYETLSRRVAVFGVTGLPVFFPDRLYRVGDDIAAGVYETGRVSNCYWERQDSAGAILDNHFGTALRVEVRIQRGDYAFRSEDCGPWRKIG